MTPIKTLEERIGEIAYKALISFQLEVKPTKLSEVDKTLRKDVYKFVSQLTEQMIPEESEEVGRQRVRAEGFNDAVFEMRKRREKILEK